MHAYLDDFLAAEYVTKKKNAFAKCKCVSSGLYSLIGSLFISITKNIQ